MVVFFIIIISLCKTFLIVTWHINIWTRDEITSELLVVVDVLTGSLRQFPLICGNFSARALLLNCRVFCEWRELILREEEFRQVINLPDHESGSTHTNTHTRTDLFSFLCRVFDWEQSAINHTPAPSPPCVCVRVCFMIVHLCLCARAGWYIANTYYICYYFVDNINLINIVNIVMNNVLFICLLLSLVKITTVELFFAPSFIIISDWNYKNAIIVQKSVEFKLPI